MRTGFPVLRETEFEILYHERTHAS